MRGMVLLAFCAITLFPDQCQLSVSRKPKNISVTLDTSSPPTPSYYNPNPGYDAYWTDGHWIFGTTTTKPRVTTSTMTRMLVCKKPCPIEYRSVPKVCGHQVNLIRKGLNDNDLPVKEITAYTLDPMASNYRTFSSYCEFLAFQCKDKIWNNMGWVFIHFGDCVADEDVGGFIDNDKAIVDRKNRLLKAYKVSSQTIASEYFKNKRERLPPSACASPGMRTGAGAVAKPPPHRPPPRGNGEGAEQKDLFLIV
ncbi:uncharacterized protein LOC134799671 [Cydia splendana]|uniref:uncharacterized protein LOC134799671 n=1 Tax=Cydia splendana TaxID=1100963 RepID=UPI00300CB5A9